MTSLMGLCYAPGRAFDEQMGGFMLVLHIAGGGGISFREHQMACDPESRRAVRLEELVGAWPAVEADSKAVVLQDAVHFARRQA